MGNIILGCSNNLVSERIKRNVKGNQIYPIDANVVALRRALTQYKPDLIILDSSYQVPNISVVIEQILFQDIAIIYISNAQEKNKFYMHSQHELFHQLNTLNIERELSMTIATIGKYITYIRKIKHDLNVAEKKLDEEKVISRAKFLLMEKKKCSEDDAHNFIRRHSMDKRVSKKEIAEIIIKKYLTK